MLSTLSIDAVRTALRSRATTLLPTLHAEATDCYRLFHGAVEGGPGCTLDRYGELLLFQTFRDAPDIPAEELLPLLRDMVEEETGLSLKVHWNARQRRQQSREGLLLPKQDTVLSPSHSGSELGVKYLIDVPQPGRDPNLYLDFRVARRWLRNNVEGKDVLNAFAYTCGAGVASLAGGAASVVNLDFSESALSIGRRNAELNGFLDEDAFECLCGDAMPALRMLAGLPVTADRRRGNGRGGRGARGGRWAGRGQGQRGRGAGRGSKPLKLRRRQFDVVVLDPPTVRSRDLCTKINPQRTPFRSSAHVCLPQLNAARAHLRNTSFVSAAIHTFCCEQWTKTKFGAVDLVRDYESLFKPSVLATRPGGTVLAANHVASVDVDEWLEKLDRCANKADQPLSELSLLTPEADFPSPDGKHPLKIAIAKVAEIA